MSGNPKVTHCKKGHEYTPENTRYKSDGRRLCKKCTDFCIRGHEFTPENTAIRTNGTRKCKACQRLRNRGRPSSSRGCKHGVYPARNCIECKYARSVVLYERKGMEPRSFDEFAEKSKVGPLDYLMLTPEQARATEAFNFAVDTKGRPLCEKPTILKTGKKYFPHADFDPERPPSVTEAARMCMGCPVFEECAELGKQLNFAKSKSNGVFAGEVWVNGKRVVDKK